MTVLSLLEHACALVPGTKAADKTLQQLCFKWLEILLEESRNCENSLRGNSLEKLASAPEIVELGEEIEYSAVLLKTALPYGLAAFVAEEDDNAYLAANMRMRFIAALLDLQRYSDESILAGGV